MAFHVKGSATDRVVRERARINGKTPTETIREAVGCEYAAVTIHEAAVGLHAGSYCSPRRSIAPVRGPRLDKAGYRWVE